MAKQDGGPAFPRPSSVDTTSGTLPDGDETIGDQSGMTLRDWFAGQALVGILNAVAEDTSEANNDPDVIALHAYTLADAMLEARS